MARIEDIERRLLNWARWQLGAGDSGLGYSGVDLTLENVGRDGYAEAMVPTSDVEADETDQGVKALAYQLQETVRVVYVGAGGMRDKARRLHCSEATLYSRVDQAHYQLASWLSGRFAARCEQRSRMEALQASARPKG